MYKSSHCLCLDSETEKVTVKVAALAVPVLWNIEKAPCKAK